MAKAKKLKSGSWRVQVYAGSETVVQSDGSIKEKKIRKSFTVKDPSPAGRKECERLAAEWAASHDQAQSCDLTFGQALDEYISSRESVLSPRTIMDYRCTRRNYLQELMMMKVDRITQEDIQKEINFMSRDKSPKTVRNAHNLVTAVMRVYRPDFAVHTILPKRVRPDIYVPSDDEIRRLIACAKDTDMELPILLAAFGPMRRGEICALSSEDITGNIVHVRKNMVKAGSNKWILKAPKSYAGDRYIEYPDYVAEKWKGKTGRIVNINPNQVTHKFGVLLRKAGLPHFRFHDLRHYAASIQHAIGIPDAYIMARGGWGNDGTLKTIYRHVMEDKTAEMNHKANSYFSELVSDASAHESAHENEKTL